MNRAMEEARALLEGARSIAVLTGAGISAESGIPTFRGPGGLWRNFRPEELATPQAFARDPKLVWEWYQWRRQVIARAEPNAAHFALVKLSQVKPGTLLITQNVDGLHDRAGSPDIAKLHGDIWRVRCTRCEWEGTDLTVEFPTLPPPCQQCGGALRPGVVWFGEDLPQSEWQRAAAAVEHSDVLLVAGTSAVVYPAAGLIGMAKGSRATVIEVNLEDTPHSHAAAIRLRGGCGEIIPQLIPAF